MRVSTSALTLLLIATASTAAAQGPGGERAGRMFNPAAVDGPPAPAAFAGIVGLTSDQQPKYAALHKSYMTATQARRDSLKAIREEVRTLMQSGGREAARPRMEAMRGLATAVNERYEEFESELQFLLTAPQQAKFAEWKEKERTRMMEERRQRMGDRSR